jgi:outer membrane immunogenic protein
MKKLLLAGAAFLSLMTAASAADLAARPYTKAPPLSPAYNWSGFYIGAMGGYAFDSDNGGGFGGGTIGYNWQFPGSQFVFGIEVDAAGASIKESQAAIVNGAVGTVEDKMDALGSVTGRVGVAVDAALFYAKGGYAWANNKLSASAPALGFAVSDSHVHSGYTIGGGLEYMFAPNWSAKAEYQYYNFGNTTFTTGPGDIVGTRFRNDEHTAKVGINYRFGWGGPAAARY